MPIHDAARGFETSADAYERGRPEYPRAAIDLLPRSCGSWRRASRRVAPLAELVSRPSVDVFV
jgi:hypothetical protein